MFGSRTHRVQFYNTCLICIMIDKDKKNKISTQLIIWLDKKLTVVKTSLLYKFGQIYVCGRYLQVAKAYASLNDEQYSDIKKIVEMFWGCYPSLT
jgi:hypothetical protein